MHPVQKQILSQLIFNPCFPFSKLKSKEVEGNLFIYHLKQLITEGLVQKTSDGKYELTLEGKIYTDKLSLKTFKPRIQPKIATLQKKTSAIFRTSWLSLWKDSPGGNHPSSCPKRTRREDRFIS